MLSLSTPSWAFPQPREPYSSTWFCRWSYRKKHGAPFLVCTTLTRWIPARCCVRLSIRFLCFDNILCPDFYSGNEVISILLLSCIRKTSYCCCRAPLHIYFSNTPIFFHFYLEFELCRCLSYGQVGPSGLDPTVFLSQADFLYEHVHRDPLRCYAGGIRSSGNNVLLHGPPGTGKTTIAQAASQEAGAAFYSVTPSSILSKYQGALRRQL